MPLAVRPPRAGSLRSVPGSLPRGSRPELGAEAHHACRRGDDQRGHCEPVRAWQSGLDRGGGCWDDAVGCPTRTLDCRVGLTPFSQ
ncbi:MAG: hypothetical protein H8E24_03035 [Verrucomicrobia bacterium]|nr:hypothetical protein [Verrucomicrobiota bacterium]